MMVPPVILTVPALLIAAPGPSLVMVPPLISIVAYSPEETNGS